MMDIVKLQNKIDFVFPSIELKVQKAREGSGGFFIVTPIMTRVFIDWMEEVYDVKFKNVQADNEEGYVKAFFEELTI